MKKFLSSIVITSLIISLEIFAFGWPLGAGTDPQNITSTFGEFRVPCGGYPTNHFHDGVDIQGLYDSDGPIWGVRKGVEKVWEITEHGVRTDHHDFAHLEDINPELDEEDSVWAWTKIAESYQASWNHLHFCIREERQSALTANNPLNPDFDTEHRFTNYYADYNDPIIHDIFITPNGDYSQVLDPGNIPEYTEVDIIVKAEEETTNPEGADPNNGVFKVMYDITDPAFEPYYITVFEFSYKPEIWNIEYVYDNTRSDNSNFYYVVTNGESYDDYWYPAEGEYQIHVKVKDEQGNDDEQTLNVTVTKGSGVDEEKPGKFDLSVKSLNATSKAIEIRYSLPKKNKVDLNIYDAMGRVVNTLVNKEQKAGIYTVKWNKKNKLGEFLPNGIYFCDLRAGDFKTNKKIVLLGH